MHKTTFDEYNIPSLSYRNYPAIKFFEKRKEKRTEVEALLLRLRPISLPYRQREEAVQHAREKYKKKKELYSITAHSNEILQERFFFFFYFFFPFSETLLAQDMCNDLKEEMTFFLLGRWFCWQRWLLLQQQHGPDLSTSSRRREEEEEEDALMREWRVAHLFSLCKI
jgi:hypothetical protein